MRFEHQTLPFSDLLDARPANDHWGMLTRGGTLLGKQIDLGGLNLEKPIELHLSQDTEFAAVVERKGQFGRVFGREGQPLMELNGGDYRTEHSIFPAAFLEQGGRNLLVHGTDWNRLDITELDSGRILTPRSPTSATEREETPDHYLDYFHAGLSVSPDGKRIAEDGWIWHPMGQVRTWSIDNWLAHPWESEDGPSIREYELRHYFWDGPLCWIDCTTLAVWGLGDDEEDMKPGVTFYDVLEGTKIASFPGPEAHPDGWMVFDEWLFAIGPRGTGVWEIQTGAEVHFEKGFTPRRYHPARREFLSWNSEEIFATRLVH